MLQNLEDTWLLTSNDLLMTCDPHPIPAIANDLVDIQYTKTGQKCMEWNV